MSKGFLGGCVVVYAGVFAFVINAVILAAVETKNRLYIMTLVGYVLFVISDESVPRRWYVHGIRLPLPLLPGDADLDPGTVADRPVAHFCGDWKPQGSSQTGDHSYYGFASRGAVCMSLTK